MRNIKNFGLAAILLGVGAITGCGKDTPDFEAVDYTIERYDVDQVFAGSYGYTVLRHDKLGEVLSELFYYNGYQYNNKLSLPILEDKDKKNFKGIERADKHVRIFKDLGEKEQSYAQIVRYNDMNAYYVEIHLQKNQGISPGQEVIRVGKRTENRDLEEVK